MSEKNINLVVAYYQALTEKNFSAVEKLLHPNIRLLSPLAEVIGKEAVLNSAKQFADFFKEITIRARFGANEQVMLAYNIECPAPVNTLRAAVLITIEDDLIRCIELFYDTRLIAQYKEQIFAAK